MESVGMKSLHMAAFILLIVGGLNWLLLGVFQWEIGMLFGGTSAILSRVIYVLIGAAAVYEIFTHRKNCKACATGGGSGGSAAAPTG